ncbi:MAG: AGE family epimerase/isomerase, partial [Pseudomonadota bacterium]
MRAALKQRIRAWLISDALPLWRGIGVDDEGFGVFEALDHQGAPRADLPKRLRVQARQVYVFAETDRVFGAGDGPLAARLFADLWEIGFVETGGRLAAATDRAGAPLSTPHDLYDLAFMIFAAAALPDGANRRGDELWRALGQLKAERGWR